MTQDEAIAVAQQFALANGMQLGPVKSLKYWSSAEWAARAGFPLPPHWSIYFDPTEQVANSPAEQGLDMPDFTVINVDDATGVARVVMWL